MIAEFKSWHASTSRFASPILYSTELQKKHSRTLHSCMLELQQGVCQKCVSLSPYRTGGVLSVSGQTHATSEHKSCTCVDRRRRETRTVLAILQHQWGGGSAGQARLNPPEMSFTGSATGGLVGSSAGSTSTVRTQEVKHHGFTSCTQLSWHFKLSYKSILYTVTAVSIHHVRIKAECSYSGLIM